MIYFLIFFLFSIKSSERNQTKVLTPSFTEKTKSFLFNEIITKKSLFLLSTYLAGVGSLKIKGKISNKNALRLLISPCIMPVSKYIFFITKFETKIDEYKKQSKEILPMKEFFENNFQKDQEEENKKNFLYSFFLPRTETVYKNLFSSKDKFSKDEFSIEDLKTYSATKIIELREKIGFKLLFHYILYSIENFESQEKIIEIIEKLDEKSIHQIFSRLKISKITACFKTNPSFSEKQNLLQINLFLRILALEPFKEKEITTIFYLLNKDFLEKIPQSEIFKDWLREETPRPRNYMSILANIFKRLSLKNAVALFIDIHSLNNKTFKSFVKTNIYPYRNYNEEKSVQPKKNNKQIALVLDEIYESNPRLACKIFDKLDSCQNNSDYYPSVIFYIKQLKLKEYILTQNLERLENIPLERTLLEKRLENISLERTLLEKCIKNIVEIYVNDEENIRHIIKKNAKLYSLFIKSTKIIFECIIYSMEKETYPYSSFIKSILSHYYKDFIALFTEQSETNTDNIDNLCILLKLAMITRKGTEEQVHKRADASELILNFKDKTEIHDYLKEKISTFIDSFYFYPSSDTLRPCFRLETEFRRPIMTYILYLFDKEKINQLFRRNLSEGKHFLFWLILHFEDNFFINKENYKKLIFEILDENITEKLFSIESIKEESNDNISYFSDILPEKVIRKFSIFSEIENEYNNKITVSRKDRGNFIYDKIIKYKRLGI